jgi:uncharacterized protein (TIGR03118 family)
MRSPKLRCSRRLVAGAAAGALAVGVGVVVPSTAANGAPTATLRAANRYDVHNLVSDEQGKAELRDGALLNSFGIASSPTSALWVSDNHSGVATLYSGAVNGSPVTKNGLTVQIPGGSPTGQTFNPTTDFGLSPDHTNPAIFLFADEAGQISGWNPKVDPTHAVTKASDPDAIYKGLTLASTPDGSRLYAANFSEAHIDGFDGTFTPVALSPHAFTDPFIPRGFAPFNVQAIGDRIFVAFAEQNAEKEDEVDGQGLGFVDAFTTDGALVYRVFPHEVLNAPWGMVMAPQSFGRFGGALFVGNFGNGLIHAFDPRTGLLLGSLHDSNGGHVQIGRLWALRVGNTTFGGTDAIVFSAGPGDEEHGLVGTLTPAAA